MKKEKKNDILVSVVIPVYNREKLLERALFSVINQSYKNLEIIIIDDGSTDNTKKVIDNFKKKEKREDIIYVYQDNRGASSARNKGVLIAKGQYVSFLDSDDEYFKDKIERHLQKITESGADFSICNEVQVRNGFYNKKNKKEKKDLFIDVNYFVKLFPSHSVSLFFIKREVFLKYLFDENQLVLDDTEFILRYLAQNNIFLIGDILIKRHKDLKSERLSLSPEKKTEGLRKVILKIKRGDYNIRKDLKNNLLFRLYFQLGIFNILKYNKKEAQESFSVAKNITGIPFSKKIECFFIVVFLFFPFSQYLIIYIGKILWKIGIIEGK